MGSCCGPVTEPQLRRQRAISLYENKAFVFHSQASFSWWQSTNWFIPFFLKYIVLPSLVCRSCVLHSRDVRRFELPHSKIERKFQEKWEPWVDGLGKLLVNTGQTLASFCLTTCSFHCKPLFFWLSPNVGPGWGDLLPTCTQMLFSAKFEGGPWGQLQTAFVCGSFFSADVNKHTWKAHPCLNIYFSHQIFLQTRSQHIRGQTVFWGMCQDFILWGCT